MTYLTTLKRYLQNEFPGLELGAGLFYRWPIGIRFELGVQDERIPNRPAVLYEACFGTEDSCIVMSQDWDSDANGTSSRRFERLFSSTADIGLQEPCGTLRVVETEEDSEANEYTLTWVRQPSRSIDYKVIFQLIANADLAISPAISSKVYFLNLEKGIIFHMYDDRGLDVIASRAEEIFGLYTGFNEWILDYDRRKIDKVFASKGAGAPP